MDPVSATSIVIAVPRAGAPAAARIVVLEAHRAPTAPDECTQTEQLPCPLRCDVSAIGTADAPTLDAIARLQLVARRLGTSVELTNAAPALVDVLELAGLTDVFPNARSGVEVHGQAEEREQLRVDEEVDPGDAPL